MERKARLKADRDRHARLSEQRKASGLCIKCGEVNTREDGVFTCYACIENRIQQRRNKGELSSVRLRSPRRRLRKLPMIVSISARAEELYEASRKKRERAVTCCQKEN